MNTKIKDLFPITQAAKVCGLSRSTLLRLEERGLLTPAYITPKSGRRYYDNNNITRILQIQKFQWMGFSTEEIISYFSERGNADGLLAILERKLSVLQQQVTEMRMRANVQSSRTIQIIQLPEMVCCLREYRGFSFQHKYDALYNFFHECVENGCALSYEPLFFVNKRTDYLKGRISHTPYDFQACVPVIPEKAPDNAVRFPACTALSLLYSGNYHDIEDSYLCLGREVRKQGLTPAGFVRAINLVAPYVGLEIDPNRYCLQLVLPIEEAFAQ